MADFREIMVRCKFCGMNYIYTGQIDPGCCGSKKCVEKLNGDPTAVSKTTAGKPSAITPVVFGDNTMSDTPKIKKTSTTNEIVPITLDSLTPQDIFVTSAGSQTKKTTKPTSNTENTEKTNESETTVTAPIS